MVCVDDFLAQRLVITRPRLLTGLSQQIHHRVHRLPFCQILPEILQALLGGFFLILPGQLCCLVWEFLGRSQRSVWASRGSLQNLLDPWQLALLRANVTALRVYEADHVQQTLDLGFKATKALVLEKLLLVEVVELFKGLLQLLWIPTPLDAEQALQQTLVDLHAFLSGLANRKEWVGALDGKSQSLWGDALAQENIDVVLV